MTSKRDKLLSFISDEILTNLQELLYTNEEICNLFEEPEEVELLKESLVELISDCEQDARTLHLDEKDKFLMLRKASESTEHQLRTKLQHFFEESLTTISLNDIKRASSSILDSLQIAGIECLNSKSSFNKLS